MTCFKKGKNCNVARRPVNKGLSMWQVSGAKRKRERGTDSSGKASFSYPSAPEPVLRGSGNRAGVVSAGRKRCSSGWIPWDRILGKWSLSEISLFERYF